MMKSLEFFAFWFLTIGIVNCHVPRGRDIDGIGFASKGLDDYQQKIASQTGYPRAILDRNAARDKNLDLYNRIENLSKSTILPERSEFATPLLKDENLLKRSRKIRSPTKTKDRSSSSHVCYFKLCKIGR